MEAQKGFAVFAGRSHPTLAKEIATFLEVSLGDVVIEDFPDGEIGVRIGENVRGRDVFVVQSMAKQPNFYLMELLILIDALRRASAGNIIAVIPYYCYARQDRKDQGRQPITAKLVADLLERVGVTSVLTMDLHTEQVEGFFNIPVDNLYAGLPLIEAVHSCGIKQCVVVTPDIGGVKRAREFSALLQMPMAVINKRRLSAKQVEPDALIGDVKERDVLLVDDMYSTGETLKKAAKACKVFGAKRIFAAVTHGLMVGGTQIDSSIDKLFVTNTVELPDKCKKDATIQVVSVASLFAQAMQSIMKGLSISSLSKT